MARGPTRPSDTLPTLDGHSAGLKKKKKGRSTFPLSTPSQDQCPAKIYLYILIIQFKSFLWTRQSDMITISLLGRTYCAYFHLEKLQD